MVNPIPVTHFAQMGGVAVVELGKNFPIMKAISSIFSAAQTEEMYELLETARNYFNMSLSEGSHNSAMDPYLFEVNQIDYLAYVLDQGGNLTDERAAIDDGLIDHLHSALEVVVRDVIDFHIAKNLNEQLRAGFYLDQPDIEDIRDAAYRSVSRNNSNKNALYNAVQSINQLVGNGNWQKVNDEGMINIEGQTFKPVGVMAASYVTQSIVESYPIRQHFDRAFDNSSTNRGSENDPARHFGVGYLFLGEEKTQVTGKNMVTSKTAIFLREKDEAGIRTLGAYSKLPGIENLSELGSAFGRYRKTLDISRNSAGAYVFKK